MKVSIKTIAMLLAVCGMAAFYAAGCGGGGGSAPAVAAAPAPASGMGRIAADVHLKGPSGLARAVFQSGDVITIDIMITGYYAEDGSEFAPVTAEGELSGASYLTISVLDVPIGYNHVLTAIATYPDGSTETVKCIIPSVSESVTTTATADERSTVIAEVALAYAADEGIPLSDITADEIEAIGAIVDELAASGVSYSEMTGEGIIEYDEYSDVLDSVEIWPATATVLVGESFQFTGMAKNKYGEFIDASYTYEVDGAVGTIDNDGLFIATAPGEGEITVTASAPIILDTTAVRTAAQAAPITTVALVTVTACFDSYDCEDGDTATFNECIGGGTAAAYCTSVQYPYTETAGIGTVTFGDQVSTTISSFGGTPPYQVDLTYGMLPPGWTFDPSTGSLAGEIPQYVSSWSLYFGVVDSGGLASDPMMDSVISFTLSVSDDLAYLQSAFQTADAALQEISDLLNQMYQLAVSEVNMHDSMNDSNYQAALAQIDTIVTSASYDGSLLLDGTFASWPIEVPLTGPVPGHTIGTVIDDMSTTALNLYGTDIISGSTASGNLTYIQNAMTMVSQNRAEIGATSNVVNMAASSLNMMTMYMPSGMCLDDLYTTAAISDGILAEAYSALMSMYQLAVQANNNTLTSDQLAAMQAEINAYADYIDHIELVIYFAGNMLFDGNLSETCTDAGSPTLANPQINATALYVDGVDLANNAAKAVLDIDGAMTQVEGYRTDIGTTITTLQGMGVGGGAVGRVLN